MTARQVVTLNETTPQLEVPQSSDTYSLPRNVDVSGNITVSGTVDGRDIDADGGVLDTAMQPAAIDSLVKLNALVLDATLGDSGDFATAAQGTLAASATQPGDNVSTLTNDAGYVTSGGAFSADADTQITPETAIVLDHETNNEIALNIAYQTNKASGNDTGLVINQTDVASPGTSMMAVLQVGGAWKFQVKNDGRVELFGVNAKDSFYKSGDNFVVSSAGRFLFGHDANLSSGDAFTFKGVSNDRITASSGAQAYVHVLADINQSGTAASTALLVNRTETALGSGAQLSLDLQVDGISIVSVDNTGTLTTDKTTADEAFINFKATADADATSAISTNTTSGATTHHVQIEINGVTAWIAVSTTDPT